MTVRRCLWDHRSFLIIFITPFLLLPLPLLVTDQKGTCGYMLILMGVYWCTEAMPLAVTGMIPVFLAPMFGILTTTKVCNNYLKSIVMMFTGGLIVAIGIEKSNLHKRIALAVLRLIGTRPRSLMFGFMLPTWFLSMWISNTATTAMMIPIMEAVLAQVKQTQEEEYETDNQPATTNGTNGLELGDIGLSNAGFDEKVSNGDSGDTVHNDTHTQKNHVTGSRENNTAVGDSEAKLKDKMSKEFENFCKGMTVAVAYAANVGGTATLTGTGPNTIMKGHADDLWKAKGFTESPVTYSTWFIYGFPVAVINIVFVYLWLVIFYLGLKGFKCTKEDPQKSRAIKDVILREYKALGSIKFNEAAVAVMFVILVLLWFFRAPGFMPGWGSGFKKGYIADAVPAIFMAVLLFAIPMQIPRCNKVKDTGPAKALLDWQTVHERFPWSIIFLMGGGFALAEACQVSGLSAWIGEQLAVFGNLPDWVMVAIICLLVAMLTEVTSNSATCTILMPIVASLAESLNRNPLYLMFPTAISTSFAFMLPVATPPNAIAFSYGRISVFDMVKAGAILNVLCVITVTLANHTWGMAFFDLGTVPWPTGVENTTAIMQ